MVTSLTKRDDNPMELLIINLKTLTRLTLPHQTKYFTSTTTNKESSVEGAWTIMIRKWTDTDNKIQLAHFDQKLVWMCFMIACQKITSQITSNARNKDKPSNAVESRAEQEKLVNQ